MAVTVAGGLYGLSTGQPGGGHVLALGLLLAVSAGLLALELARLFAFAAGGTTVWLAAGALFPECPRVGRLLPGRRAGRHPLLPPVDGMALTSLLGTLLAGHAGLVLAATLTDFDAIGWGAGSNSVALSIAVGLVSPARAGGPGGPGPAIQPAGGRGAASTRPQAPPRPDHERAVAAGPGEAAQRLPPAAPLRVLTMPTVAAVCASLDRSPRRTSRPTGTTSASCTATGPPRSAASSPA